MTKTLLIDGDLFAYQTAAAEERAYEWEPGQWTYTADATQGADFHVEGDTLRIVLTLDDADALARYQQVIENHLQRFARDETPAFDWRPA